MVNDVGANDKVKKRKKDSGDSKKSFTIYVSKHFDVEEWLVALFAKAKQFDLVNKSYLDDEQEAFSDEFFAIKYTIPRSSLKDVSIKSAFDYKEMIGQASKKGSPEALISLLVVDEVHFPLLCMLTIDLEAPG